MVEDAQEALINIDIGGWTGEVFLEEARNHPEQKFMVIDPDIALPVPKKEIPSNLTYIKAQVEKLRGGIPLKNASVDRVLIEQVFDSLDTSLWKSLFEETARILKRDGRLEIIDLLRNEKEILWSLPNYDFSQIETRYLGKKEGNRVTRIFAEHPQLFPPSVRITAIKD